MKEGWLGAASYDGYLMKYKKIQMAKQSSCE